MGGSRSLPSLYSDSWTSTSSKISSEHVPLPDDLKPLTRFDLTDVHMMTIRNKSDQDGSIPTLRFRPVKVEAKWVPGTEYYVDYKPGFSLEKPIGRKSSS